MNSERLSRTMYVKERTAGPEPFGPKTDHRRRTLCVVMGRLRRYARQHPQRQDVPAPPVLGLCVGISFLAVQQRPPSLAQGQAAAEPTSAAGSALHADEDAGDRRSFPDGVLEQPIRQVRACLLEDEPPYTAANYCQCVFSPQRQEKHTWRRSQPLDAIRIQQADSRARARLG